MKNPKFSHAFEVTSDLPEALQPLKAIASNFRWTWDHETRHLFRDIDAKAWEACEHNPILFLNSLDREQLERLAKDAYFLEKLKHTKAKLDDYLAAPTFFDQNYPGAREKSKIAYFCFEFGISEGLPIYSGGLGILAGDHLKAASDLGLPLVGVGLLYNRGYFRQRLNHDGWQQEVYPQYDFYQMPLTLMRDGDDVPIRIEVEFPDGVVTCQVWRADVGRIQLYLLDSNVLENRPHDQGITDSLYSGDQEMRIRQEMILGIGGMRALRAVGINPTVCHMNEGHAAFMSLERIRQFMVENKCDFKTARQVIVSGNVFTTHTPVPAGFDRFDASMLERYLGKTVASTGISFNEFLELGRMEADNQGELFNMAILAMETANHVNGVSKLHAQVTREMFGNRWPGYPESEVPVTAVTNGIHTMTWVGQEMAELFDRFLGLDWRRNPENPDLWKGVAHIPDEDLWNALENQRGQLVRFIRKRLQTDLERRTSVRPEFGMVNSILDPRILTVGFARRFATYKRGTLMIRDKERLKNILFHPERPVQIVISGKSHPHDDGGKKLIQELVNFINHDGARARMVFLEDYDMNVARRLVQGVDVWLNNPRRPYEASGTSGMKVVPNGGLNCSILDGWWDEGYEPGIGWAIGERSMVDDEGHQDWLDSRSLYHLLENEITPVFYHRVDNGIPRSWIAMVKRSIMTHAPLFSTNRMVRDYAVDSYMAADATYQRISADGLSRAKAARDWRSKVKANWGQVRIVSVKDSAGISNALGRKVSLIALVELGSLSPEDVRVQAVVGKIGPNRELIHTRIEDLTPIAHEDGKHAFEGSIVCDLVGHQGYSVRVVPHHEDVAIPSELPLVTWEN
jgi:starch phosphorylase